MAFRFRQFIIEDDLSTMKTGTDAILLGAWAEPGNAKSILEIGTGCGVISLMLAQKSEASITAIDIDPESIVQAKANFMNSPWPDRIKGMRISLQEFASITEKKYNLILTNPPFFIGSLKSPDERKNRAKHSPDLNHQELINGVKHLLDPDGSFLLILPATENQKFSTLAVASGLFLQQELKIRPKAGFPVNRILSRFGFQKVIQPKMKELVIRSSDNSFTRNYIEFTKEYHTGLL